MGDFVQLIVSGTAAGAIYALAALGFTLLWQASGTINFAQGEFVMLPAFSILFFIGMGAPLWIAFLLACLVIMALLGVGFKKIVVDPLIRHGVIPLVIATLGLSIGIKQTVKAGIDAQPHSFPSPFPEGQLDLAGVSVSYSDIGTLVLAGLIVLGLQAFLNRFTSTVNPFSNDISKSISALLDGVVSSLSSGPPRPSNRRTSGGRAAPAVCVVTAVLMRSPPRRWRARAGWPSRSPRAPAHRTAGWPAPRPGG